MYADNDRFLPSNWDSNWVGCSPHKKKRNKNSDDNIEAKIFFWVANTQLKHWTKLDYVGGEHSIYLFEQDAFRTVADVHIIADPVLFWQPPSVAVFWGGNTLLPSQGGVIFKYNPVLFLILIAHV